MADINQIISDFLRDAQYRVATLTEEINNSKKEGYSYEEQLWLRAQLILWMDLLYDSRMSIYDGYNFLGGKDWSERDITSECEYLRKLTGMTTIPYLTFAGYSPQIRNIITGDGGGGVGFPFGNVGDILVYTVAGNTPITQQFPEEGGMIGETINEFFN